MQQGSLDFPNDNIDISRPPSNNLHSDLLMNDSYDPVAQDRFNLQFTDRQINTKHSLHTGGNLVIGSDAQAIQFSNQQTLQSLMNGEQNADQDPLDNNNPLILNQQQPASLLFPDPGMELQQDSTWYMPGAFNDDDNNSLWLQMPEELNFDNKANGFVNPNDVPANLHLDEAFQGSSSQQSMGSSNVPNAEAASMFWKNSRSDPFLDNSQQGIFSPSNGRNVSFGRILVNEGMSVAGSRRVSGKSNYDELPHKGSANNLLQYSQLVRQPSMGELSTDHHSPYHGHLSGSMISPGRALADMDVSPSTDPGSDVHQPTSQMTPEMDDLTTQSSTKYWNDKKNSFSHRASLLAANADFSPLTTTTSLTPSASSVHLTQPSFFSANQFYRTLFDQPPSLIHRPSFDVYSRGRRSLDSQGSSANQPPARNPRSFASYFPFMGDRDRKLPPRSEWLKLSQAQQPRQLIRSIFNKNVLESPTDESSQFMNDVIMDPDNDDIDFNGENAPENPIPMKKAKRTRMNLFNRFKSGKNQNEPMQQDPVKAEPQSSLASSERDDSSHQVTAPHLQSSIQNSINSGTSGGLGTGTGQEFVIQDEPDYAALFQDVGKRRLGGIKTKKLIKPEPESPKFAPISSNERSPHKSSRISNDQSDSKLAQSLQYSNASSLSVSEEEHTGTNLSSFASASKRILGLRLLKKKANQVKLDQQPDLLEIDLESLDLPPDTEIIPKINPKMRTRGRKENREADMVDQSKIFVCSYCDRRFKRQEHLKRHFRSLHTSEKPYECPNCQKKFSRTDNLNQHLKVHKQEEEEAAARRASGL